ncbi:MAG: efflux RND transporter periplasmic adaptor subunit, partial [Gemmatimonadota bacterium]
LDEQLFKNDAIARRDLEQAQTDAIATAADREAALEALRALGVDEGSLSALREGKQVQALQGTIRAPIAGTVVERLVSPGQLIQAGATATFTIADLSKMWVMANVFETDLASVHPGDAAEVTTGASPQVFHGVIDNIAALVDPNTKATAVRILVPNPGRLLKKDMYATIDIHSRLQRHGLLVPVSSVLRDDDNQPFVFLQSAESTYARHTVQLGARNGDSYEIASGLKAGDRVVTDGGLFLQFSASQ